MSTRLEFSLFNSLLQICLARLVPFHLISLRTTKMHLYICSNIRWIIRTAAGGNEGPEVLPQRIRNKGQKSLKKSSRQLLGISLLFSMELCIFLFVELFSIHFLQERSFPCKRPFSLFILLCISFKVFFFLSKDFLHTTTMLCSNGNLFNSL